MPYLSAHLPGDRLAAFIWVLSCHEADVDECFFVPWKPSRTRQVGRSATPAPASVRQVGGKGKEAPVALGPSISCWGPPHSPKITHRLAVFQAMLNRMKQLFMPLSSSHVTRRWIGLAQEPQPIASIAHPVVGRDEMMPIPDIRLVNSLCHHVAPTSTDPFAPLGSLPP